MRSASPIAALVVIAEQRDRAARGEIAHGIDHEAWIGAIADIIAEKD